MKIEKRGKKALSVMIGYILLITFGIILSIIVFAYLKTYVPKELANCPEGVSIFIEEINCTDNAGVKEINLTLQNNGKFNLAGYFIHATSASGQEVATVDLSKGLVEDLTSGPYLIGNSVIFNKISPGTNEFKPNNKTTHKYEDLSGGIYQIEIIPVRYEVQGSIQRLASCGDARVWEISDCE